MRFLCSFAIFAFEMSGFIVKAKAALLVFTIGLFFFNVEIPKRAFRLYERGDLEKTVEALNKSLAKDTLNPAANYLYAKLHVDTAYEGYSIDKAYTYINKGISNFQLISEPKDLSSLQEFGIDSLSLELQKDLIDSLQFLLIKEKHTIADYNWFMQTHTDALQIDEAIGLRNRIAFENATETNTWQSYLEFMNTYPDAEDYTEAETRYKQLIFEERTADGSYQSYVDFLKEFPNTPYRTIAEEAIFQTATTVNTIEAYADFLREYPNERLAKKIVPRLYHIYKERFDPATFFDHFDFPAVKDSLQEVISLQNGFWLPKLEDGQFSFIDAKGEVKAPSPFTAITNACKCEPVTTDFLVGTVNDKQQLTGRNGELIYEGIFDKAVDKGFGYIALENIEGVRLVHKSGERIIDLPVNSIEVLNQHFIRTEKNGLFGLTTINQKPILDHSYDLIDTLQDYLWLEKAGKIALVKPEALFPAIYDRPLDIPLVYEEIELLENNLLYAVKGGEEGILDPDLREVIPFAQHSPYDRDYGWLIEQGEQYRIIHDQYTFLKDSLFDKVVENDNWMGLKKDSTWTLLDQKGQMARAEGYDSLQLWGENMVMLFKGDDVWAQFKNGTQIPIKEGWEPKLLVPQNYVKTGAPARYDFFMLTGPKDYRNVYNSEGKEILSATYKAVTAMGPNLIKLQKRNTALVDSTGNFILKFIYQGVGSYDKGYVSILKGGKVGMLNIAKNLTIPPTYDNLITPYSDTVLLAREDDYFGFINDKNEPLSGFDFDEVRYWNDSIAMVRIEQEWILHDIAAESAIYEGITEYEFIVDSPEEKRILINTASGKGIYSSLEGELLEPSFDEIIQLGTPEEPVYYAVKIVTEANIYVVIYYDKNGNKLFTQTYRPAEYSRITCPDQ